MMAEACRLEATQTTLQVTNTDNEKFNLAKTFCVFISLVTLLADLTTELLVFAEYCKNGYIYWALITFLFLITPNIVINVFSWRWHVKDQSSSLRNRITHCVLFGLFERYIIFFYKTFTCTVESESGKNKLSQRNDLGLLHFLYTFTGTAPQIIVQSYAMIVLDENHDTKVISLLTSIASMLWASTFYTCSIGSPNDEKTQWYSLFLKFLWHFSMLVARLLSIFISSIVLGIWTFFILGLHWAVMTLWIVFQKTTFCTNKLEETFYNVVMGFVHCFCYINLREGHTRYRVLLYYSLVLTQNFGSLLIFLLLSDFLHRYKQWSIILSVLIIAGSLFGIFGMTFYYRWFHAKGPIIWKNEITEVELNNKVTKQSSNINKSNLRPVRSFKSSDLQIDCEKKDNTTNEQIVKNNLSSEDKKFLLDQWIARSGTPLFVSAPIDNSVASIDIHTIAASPLTELNAVQNAAPAATKMCLPNDIKVKLIDKINLVTDVTMQKQSRLLKNNDTNLDLQKEYTSYERSKIDEYSETSIETEVTNKKSSSDSIDLDLDLSLSDINSSDINTFNENIVQKLCLSALKNIKDGNQDADIDNIQKIAVDILKEMHDKKEKGRCDNDQDLSRNLDTPTESLSVHDYENICAVNIAREAWGIRSWNGYSDIENWLHDGSVVRDRRHDTLTSDSTDWSSSINRDFKNSILSAAGFSKKAPTYSNVFIRSDSLKSFGDETYLARPCFIDNNETNYLEPIIEELNDVCDFECNKIEKQNSERSLVATIDKIHQVTATNSPRNLYYRRERMWNSPISEASTKNNYNLKKALWKEPNKMNINNIMKSIPEKALITSAPQTVTSRKNKSLCSKCQDNMLSTSDYENINKSINLPTKDKRELDASFEASTSFTKIDMLWKLVSENHTTENVVYKNRISPTCNSSSTQSLLLQETNECSKIDLKSRKKIKSKPRRKFSILKEKFEPRSPLKNYENSANTCYE